MQTRLPGKAGTVSELTRDRSRAVVTKRRNGLAFGDTGVSLYGEIIWLPIVDTFRTLCVVPTDEVRAILEQVRNLPEPFDKTLEDPSSSLRFRSRGIQCPGGAVAAT